ncbi:MAG: M66 family metalloprotease [Opitutales bacterium]|nr:M66 family metalloprotease [Opitutales bacterium]
MKRTSLAILALLTATFGANAEPPLWWGSAIDFTEDHEILPNLVGGLEGEIAFLQNTLVGPKRGEKKRPSLVVDRAAYLLFYPAKAAAVDYKIVLRNHAGRSLTLDLSPPWSGARNDSGNKDGRPAVVYSKRAWSVLLPWEYMVPGLRLEVWSAEGAIGRLPPEAFEFGAPIELVTQNIQLGMLLPPADVQVNKWCWPAKNLSPELAINYFQMVPVAKYTAAQYLPIHFPKVVLPNGTVYTQHSTSENPGIYRGDMRQWIAKCMVSTGINLANVGIPSSIGGTEKQPRPYRQTTVHTTSGMYLVKDKDGTLKPKLVRHGLSGGGGQLTLSNTTGNEYSHEYGHDHGLGHYPGGPVYSSHIRNGAWGYHLFKHRLIANLDWNGKRPKSGLPYGFGRDAMAGGKPMGVVSEFTLHTPFSLRAIQDKVGSQSGVLDSSSPTGYRKWNSEKQAMEAFNASTPKPDLFGVQVMTLVGFYDPVQPNGMHTFIYPALYGNWGNAFSPETLLKHFKDLQKTTCWLQVTDDKGSKYRFPLHAERLKEGFMNQFHVNLPSSVRYVQAAILFKDVDGERELDSRQLTPPQDELPAPVIVGREHGFTAAALRLRDMDSVLTRNGYPSESQLHRAMEDYYGPVEAYAEGVSFQPGRVYRYKGAYAQALPTVSGDKKARWRILGQAKDYLSTRRLALGKPSIDYAKEVMKGNSGVYYYVPVDHETVLASDSFSPAARKWYAGGAHSKLTVNAKAPDGIRLPMVLRGQINGRHVLHRGAPVNESSRIKFTFHKEDNPDLPANSYAISFPAYAQGWHTNKLIESFLVEGEVQVLE